VADPRRESGASARAQAGPVAVDLRASRSPLPANDNRFPWLKQTARIAPSLAAVALLAWALGHAFGVL